MANATVNLKISAGVRLDINRDSEVLNQFVRINLDEPQEVIEGDQKSPLKIFVPHKPEQVALAKTLIFKKTKEERRVEFDQGPQVQQQSAPVQKDQQQQQQQDQEQEQQQSADEKQEKAERKDKSEKPTTTGKIGQKQLNQELRKRRKKRKRPKPEEVYTDKDRAAAVNLGTRDIKQSLKIKRKQDRSRVLQIPEEAEPSTFLALGNFEMSTGDPAIALGFLHKALELNPAEKNSLVARSKCYLLLGQPENGLKDAEAALVIDKNFMKAIYQKAEALYYLGDFEHSLMYYHRGLRIRPEHEGFQLGVHKAQKAIENAIGGAFPGAKTPSVVASTRKSSSKSRATSSMKTPSTKDTPEPKMKDTPEPKTSEFTPSQRNTPMPASRPKTAASKTGKLLRELQTDKEYLDNLLKHPDLKCKNKEDDSVIVGYIQEAVDFLNNRQEFWRQQLPNTCK